MKFICLQENLKEGLAVCERAIGKNLTLPILNNILIEDDNGRIKISSTDLEMGVNFWFSGKVVEKGSVTCPARMLAGFVNNLGNQKIELESKGTVLIVKTDSVQSSIQGLNADDFPIIPKIKNKDFLEVSSLVFKTALGQIINSVAVSENRPEIAGILLRDDEEGVVMVGTDSFRLGERKIPGKYVKKIKDSKNQSVIFPQKIAQELIRVIGDDDKTLKIFIDPNQILFDLENTQLVSRLIEGQYPDYQAIIPSKVSSQVSVLKDDLLGAVKIAGIFSSKINDVKIKAVPQKSFLEIASQSEHGSHQSKVPAKISGNPMEVVFNFRYLIDGLSNIASKEVVLGFTNENNSAILKGADDQNYLYIVMPIRSN